MISALAKFDILLLFPALMAFAAATDLVSMTISNRTQILLIAGFAVVAVIFGFDMTQLLQHGLAFLILLGVSFICFARGWIGGGDAKLAACIALWFGMTRELYEYVLLSACLGGLLTLAILYTRSLALPEALSRQGWILRLHDDKQGIPYGIALAIAALLIYPETSIFMLALK